jgi:hypothetical protein
MHLIEMLSGRVQVQERSYDGPMAIMAVRSSATKFGTCLVEVRSVELALLASAIQNYEEFD